MPIQLPIDDRIGSIVASLRACPVLVLKAPPGAGKTTRVPPALLDAGLVPAPRGIVVLEPRRLAARSAAARVAAERGGTLGEETGYRVRFESAVSPRTRLTFVTEGVLVRRLLSDPLLEDTGAVILDEFHERSAEADLALALLRELRETVRPDLILVVMSATLDPEPIARYLGDCPIIESEGRAYPVVITHAPRVSAEPIEVRAVAAAAMLLESDPTGSVLVFLPGAAEIRRALQAAQPLAERRGVELCPLHGDLPPEEQDRVVRAGPRPRIVLSTNVAEASITVAGVTGVVDSGLARVSRRDPRSGLNRLSTVRIARSSAVQRAGRAGRFSPGRCVRLFTAGEFAALAEWDEPEIRRIDLAEILLAQLAWGARDPFRFGWLDAPEAGSVLDALHLLRGLGAIDPASPDARPALSSIGRALLRFPVHPRLGRVLVEGDRRGCRGDAAVLAALLSERDIRADARASLDVEAARGAGGGRPDAGSGRARAEATVRGSSDVLERRDELETAVRLRFDPGALRATGIDARAARRAWQTAGHLEGRGSPPRGRAAEDDLLRCLLAGYPDRVVRRRGPGSRDGLMVGGVGARLDDASVVRDGELLVALDAAPIKGAAGRFVLVRSASLVRREWLAEIAPNSIREEAEVRFDEGTGRVIGLRRSFYLDLPLDERETGSVDPGRAAALLHQVACAAPARAIPLEPELEQWFRRLRWLLSIRPDLGAALAGGDAGGQPAGEFDRGGKVPAVPPGDPVVDAAGPLLTFFLEALRTWCDGKRSLQELREGPLISHLDAALPGVVTAALAQLAPKTVALPSGRSARLEYRAAEAPVLAARVQEFFGGGGGPKVGGGRVPVLLHLLAPNHRPLQVTSDLASFWANVYPKIRVELRRRYPRHAWPDDPRSAAPERGPKRRDARKD